MSVCYSLCSYIKLNELYIIGDGSISGRGTAMFVCDNGQNIDINFPLLCDGFPHCFDGSDETSALCESKYLCFL